MHVEVLVERRYQMHSLELSKWVSGTSLDVFGYVVNVVSQFRYDPDSLASCSENTEKINRIRKKEREKKIRKTKHKQTNKCFANIVAFKLFLFTFEIERKVLIYKHLIYLLRDTESYAIRFKYPARICSIFLDLILCANSYLFCGKKFFIKKIAVNEWN